MDMKPSEEKIDLLQKTLVKQKSALQDSTEDIALPDIAA